MTVQPLCPRCRRVHCSTDARAVDRFRPGGPSGYRADCDGSPLRPTRAEAVRDMCDHHAAKWTGDGR